MLSRIARGLYELGRQVERAQHVVRILEVNHKMNLERVSVENSNVWSAIAESFACELVDPSEEDVYGELVLSDSHPFSVRLCVERARGEGRAMRDHISEEMWLHLNRTRLDLAPLSFGEILRIGRSEFNRRIEVFGNALYGLAEDTMIRGEALTFLRVGRFLERTSMICRILDIKRKALELAPEPAGAPVDVHQWQALLRSLSGYEPYRRAYDARIVPERVLDFVLKRRDFPRSLTYSLGRLEASLESLSGNPVQQNLQLDVRHFLEELRTLDSVEAIDRSTLETEVRGIDRRLRALDEGLEIAYFTSLRPASPPIVAAPGASLVPQQ